MSSSPLLDWAERQLSRQSDPATSRKAAREIAPKANLRSKQFLDALKKLGQASANEVAMQVAPDNHGLFGSVRRRASDLYASGEIKIIGKRKCNVTGKEVNVYEVVQQNTD